MDGRDGTELSLTGNGIVRLSINVMYARHVQSLRCAARETRGSRATLCRGRRPAGRGHLHKALDDKLGFFVTVTTNGVRREIRELHGYAPWTFGVPVPARCGVAWNQLTDEKGFAAPFGLTFPERRASGFKVVYEGHPCQWNGPSWPFATSVALTGLANAIASGSSGYVQKEDFVHLLKQYAAQQVRKTVDGRVIPWVDENLDPFTGIWLSREMLMKRGAKIERGED